MRLLFATLFLTFMMMPLSAHAEGQRVSSFAIAPMSPAPDATDPAILHELQAVETAKQVEMQQRLEEQKSQVVEETLPVPIVVAPRPRFAKMPESNRAVSTKPISPFEMGDFTKYVERERDQVRPARSVERFAPEPRREAPPVIISDYQPVMRPRYSAPLFRTSAVESNSGQTVAAAPVRKDAPLPDLESRVSRIVAEDLDKLIEE